jgi:folate-dependent phosphoribosylglycinamide formyltransferase PurN
VFKKLNNILIIGSDTPHRRFIINKLLDAGYNITNCLFLRSIVKPAFNVDFPWSLEEKKELQDLYCKETRNDLDRVLSVHYPDSLTMSNRVVSDVILNAGFIIISGADLIRGEVLNAIANKSLNVHMGIAEEYRGLDSNLWAWYHGDYKNIGVSIHKLKTSLDTGDLFQVERMSITDHTEVWKLRYYESVLAVKLIGKTLNEIATQKVILRTQKSTGRYYSFMPFEIKKCLPITPNSTKLWRR